MKPFLSAMSKFLDWWNAFFTPERRLVFYSGFTAVSFFNLLIATSLDFSALIVALIVSAIMIFLTYVNYKECQSYRLAFQSTLVLLLQRQAASINNINLSDTEPQPVKKVCPPHQWQYHTDNTTNQTIQVCIICFQRPQI